MSKTLSLEEIRPKVDIFAVSRCRCIFMLRRYSFHHLLVSRHQRIDAEVCIIIIWQVEVH